MVRYRITADMAGMGVTQLGPGHTVTNNLGTGVDEILSESNQDSTNLASNVRCYIATF